MKILLAIDGSAPSQDAIEEVAHRPWPSPSTLRILSVIQPYTPPATEVVLASATLEEIRQREKQEAEQLTRQARQRIAASGLSVETAISEGDPRTAIVDAADEWQANLIVVGSHGRTGLKRLAWAASHKPSWLPHIAQWRSCGDERGRRGPDSATAEVGDATNP
jgi:nucleotide-binding universal stress UspA family protein